MEMEEYAVETLREWFQTSEPLFEENCVSSTFKDSGHGSAVVQLETSKYLIDISAWNHASCLDIHILDVATKKAKIPTIGDCASKAVFEGHLARFNNWFRGVGGENA